MRDHHQELIEAIRQFVAQRNDYPTTEELAVRLRVSIDKMRKILKAMKNAGMISPVQVWREALDGKIRPSTGYVLIAREEPQEGDHGAP